MYAWNIDNFRFSRYIWLLICFNNLAIKRHRPHKNCVSSLYSLNYLFEMLFLISMNYVSIYQFLRGTDHAASENIWPAIWPSHSRQLLFKSKDIYVKRKYEIIYFLWSCWKKKSCSLPLNWFYRYSFAFN